MVELTHDKDAEGNKIMKKQNKFFILFRARDDIIIRCKLNHIFISIKSFAKIP